MDWTAVYCLVVLFVGVLVMAFDIMGPDFAMMGMLIAVMLPGEAIVPIDKALAGFSNEGLLTVGGESHASGLLPHVRLLPPSGRVPVARIPVMLGTGQKC